jgi:hypothetical protein
LFESEKEALELLKRVGDRATKTLIRESISGSGKYRKTPSEMWTNIKKM